MQQGEVVFIDTNGIIEAVRTNCWNALTGQLTVETVQECASEARSQPRDTRGYVPVTQQDLQRLNKTYPVTEAKRAAFLLKYEDADGLHDGERDLLAHILSRQGHTPWRLCSPDTACVQAATETGWGDRLCSLEHLARHVGQSPNPPLRDHFKQRWLSTKRTQFRMP